MSYDAELIDAGLCPCIVIVDTEDGPQTGRCQGPIVPDGYACEGHTQQIEGWRAQSDAEAVEWERRQEHEGVRLPW